MELGAPQQDLCRVDAVRPGITAALCINCADEEDPLLPQSSISLPISCVRYSSSSDMKTPSRKVERAGAQASNWKYVLGRDGISKTPASSAALSMSLRLLALRAATHQSRHRVTRDRRPNIEEALPSFRGSRDRDVVNGDMYRYRHRPLTKDAQEEFDRCQSALFNGARLREAWSDPVYSLKPTARHCEEGLSEETRKYTKIFREGYEDYRRKKQEQDTFLFDGSFSRRLAGAIKRMPIFHALGFMDCRDDIASKYWDSRILADEDRLRRFIIAFSKLEHFCFKPDGFSGDYSMYPAPTPDKAMCDAYLSAGLSSPCLRGFELVTFASFSVDADRWYDITQLLTLVLPRAPFLTYARLSYTAVTDPAILETFLRALRYGYCNGGMRELDLQNVEIMAKSGWEGVKAHCEKQSQPTFLREGA
ncbi:unnamed protein product [Parascedosporium putredinis]|uniref:Uncharacterized protein n=1 Tax=Parascedosporium putredinis TaxID=1442378 RepID=A0A9P1MB81_9PEZI|nr:unnamed protein product [Parascedosporium putredinis]CAI7994130.1 unnamed protein product [Parascedosporium putredinis]